MPVSHAARKTPFRVKFALLPTDIATRLLPSNQLRRPSLQSTAHQSSLARRSKSWSGYQDFFAHPCSNNMAFSLNSPLSLFRPLVPLLPPLNLPKCLSMTAHQWVRPIAAIVTSPLVVYLRISRFPWPLQVLSARACLTGRLLYPVHFPCHNFAIWSSSRLRCAFVQPGSNLPLTVRGSVV